MKMAMVLQKHKRSVAFSDTTWEGEQGQGKSTKSGLTPQHPNQNRNRNNHLPRAPPFGAGAVCNPPDNPCERDEAGAGGWILLSFCSVTVLNYAGQVLGCNKDECTHICGDLGSLLVSPYQIVMFRHQKRN